MENTPLVSLPLFVQGPLPERSADQEHGVLGSRRVDVSHMVSARERVNQSSPREAVRDGRSPKGELRGQRINTLEKKWVDSTREKLGQPSDLALLQKTFDRMK